MERDPKTGRFLPGNKAAVGNRGNCNPKWGNKNAVKHGFYETITIMKVQDDGWLFIFQSGAGAVRINPDAYYVVSDNEKQGFAIRMNIVEDLLSRGFKLHPEKVI
ncbi:hypothetical protein [Bacillus sp. FJAT-52991]|uniref:Phage protein n=1 Tax=Bacillus kandeliae TaxID=3129297 RepID=A0ABZ2NCL0_9BACI